MRGILFFIVVLGALIDTGHCASKYSSFIISFTIIIVARSNYMLAALPLNVYSLLNMYTMS